MSPTWRTALRTLVIAGGVGVACAGVLQFRLENWPIYVTFFLLSGVLFLPFVEVLPRVALAIPEMAATIGFLYIGGLPIIVLRLFSPFLTYCLRELVPQSWQGHLPWLRPEAIFPRKLFSHGLQGGSPSAVTEWAMFSLGLGVRWWVAFALVPKAPPVASAAAIAVGELAGYTCWAMLSSLPLYPDRPLLSPASTGGFRAALSDMSLIVVLALTPFVYLIAYGFRVHGLSGAVAWSVSALGLHFMLRRLHERRLRVEEQNERLETLNRELEHRERLSAIGKMSSVVSHQILQQLGVIGIHADLIRNANEGGDPNTLVAQDRANAVAIEGALRDVNRVLTDLLVFSKDLRLNLYEHPLARVLEECIDECWSEATERSVYFAPAIPPTIHLTLDKLKMKQAIVNVLRNAITASPPGGEIVVSAALQGDAVELIVSDEGRGVPERDREAIFAPFFTTKEQGTGLGLAITRAFTEAHGGRVWVESRDGAAGARFVFHLPMRPLGNDEWPECTVFPSRPFSP